MRQAFSEELLRIASNDPRVLLLTGDHGYALFDEFRKHCPKQYINAGIAEQNMVGMAAGLARAGFIPFVYGLSAFIPIRVLEQIKLDIAHDNLHVVLLGDGAGFVYSSLGTSHQSAEDIAVTRVIPFLQVLSPADRHEQKLCMQWAYESRRPTYLRMGKADRGDVHDNPSILEGKELGSLIEVFVTSAIGKIDVLATGSMVKTARAVARSCSQIKRVWSVPSIKPLSELQLASILKNCKALVVMEEHSVYGGLGSLIAELSSTMGPLPILRIGVNDVFSMHCGSYDYLLKEHGLDIDAVNLKVKDFLLKLEKVQS